MTRVGMHVGDHRGEDGFTLVELMISLLLFSFAVAGVLSVAVSVTQGYREQRQAINAEAAVRSPIDFLADALRQASPGVSDPSKIIDYHSCKNGAIEVTNSTSGPDELDVFYASGGIVTSLSSTFTVASSTSVPVVDSSQFQAGDYVVVTNLEFGLLMKVDAVVGNTLTISSRCSGLASMTTPPPATFAGGSIVVRAQHAHFEILTGSDGIPTLWMDPDGEPVSGIGGAGSAEPLAENIEDMQIAVGVDADGVDGIEEGSAATNTDEWHYNISTDSAPTVGTAIRAVRVTLVARTAQTQFGNTSTSFYFRPKAEDRAQGAADSYRRRTLRTTVELRNIGGSP